MANKTICYHCGEVTDSERTILLALRRILQAMEIPATDELARIDALLSKQPELVPQ